MRIILTGATGLIGSRFEELMFERHEIIPFTSKNVDITNGDDVYHAFEYIAPGADIVIHLAAKTDVDGCEEDKDGDKALIRSDIGGQTLLEKMSWNWTDWVGRKNSAFVINFLGTRNLYTEAKARGIKFVYVSTDFVFKGNGSYDEDSIPNPINWYGMTKWYGERLINASDDLIVRLSFPYGYESPVKKDFVQKLIGLLRDKDEISLIEDQTITPTFIDDIVGGLDFLLQHGQTGIFNLTGSSYETPFQIGHMINEKYGFGTKINPAKREDIYSGKAERPFQSIMKNDKLVHLGFTPKTFKEGLDLIKTT